MVKKWSRRLWTAMRLHEHNQERRARGGPIPPRGYVVLTGKADDGSRLVLKVMGSDGSHSNLVGL